jgi:hypothetical protein
MAGLLQSARRRIPTKSDVDYIRDLEEDNDILIAYSNQTRDALCMKTFYLRTVSFFFIAFLIFAKLSRLESLSKDRPAHLSEFPVDELPNNDPYAKYPYAKYPFPVSMFAKKRSWHLNNREREYLYDRLPPPFENFTLAHFGWMLQSNYDALNLNPVTRLVSNDTTLFQKQHDWLAAPWSNPGSNNRPWGTVHPVVAELAQDLFNNKFLWVQHKIIDSEKHKDELVAVWEAQKKKGESAG